MLGAREGLVEVPFEGADVLHADCRHRRAGGDVTAMVSAKIRDNLRSSTHA
jgi:hypothetical protein